MCMVCVCTCLFCVFVKTQSVCACVSLCQRTFWFNNDLFPWTFVHSFNTQSNVYGVETPSGNGRAGMVAIRVAPGATMDWPALAAHVQKFLPSYSRPIFVRILGGEMEITGTFKHRKVGFVVGAVCSRCQFMHCGHCLFVASTARSSLSPFNNPFPHSQCCLIPTTTFNSTHCRSHMTPQTHDIHARAHIQTSTRTHTHTHTDRHTRTDTY